MACHTTLLERVNREAPSLYDYLYYKVTLCCDLRATDRKQTRVRSHPSPKRLFA